MAAPSKEYAMVSLRSGWLGGVLEKYGEFRGGGWDG